MYLRPVHRDLDLPRLYKFIQSSPLGVLTTAIPSPDYPLLQSSHIPWVLDIPPSSSSTTAPPQPAKLRGHLARANPHTKALIAAALSSQSSSSPASNENGITLKEEVMVLFTSQITHYITPKFYVSTKPATGKVVPTWNYAAVQVYGRITVHPSTTSPTATSFLSKQVRDLSALCEEGQMGYKPEESWTVEEAPESYVGLLSKGIAGVEIEITRIAGKWKMSQELDEGDREGVVKGFEGLGTESGKDLARLVEERARLRDGEKTG